MRPDHQLRTRLSVLALLVLTVLSASCRGDRHLTSPMGLDLAILEAGGSPANIQVPSTARAGEEIVISIRTTGLAGMTKGETRVVARGLFVVIEPLDHFPDDPTGSGVAEFTHEARVTFPQAGPARVTVRGRKWPDNTLFLRDFDIEVGG